MQGKGKSVVDNKQQETAMELDAALALSLQDITEEEEENAPSNME